MTQEPEEAPRSPARRRTWAAFVTIPSLGALLAIGFFPKLYYHTAFYDDEGFFLVVLRRFLDHGSLYVQTKTAYGPFYFSFMGLIYRLTGQTPTLFNGRLIVLVLSTLSAGVFAATVWRVTRSLAFSVLCQVTTFSVLIHRAGSEPMHPGSLIVLLVSVLVYALASYAMKQRSVLLVAVGATVGALLMTKINVGLFAATAVVVGFVVGNQQYSKRFRAIVATAALLFPFALMSQLLWQALIAEFAVLVSVSLLLAYALMHVDVISLPRKALVIVTAASAATIAASVAWPLADGTSPSGLMTGILIRPLGQVHNHAFPLGADLQWLAIVITICAVYIALGRRGESEHAAFGGSWLPNAALAVAGLWVLGLGMLGGFLAWLPAIVLLPALAWISAVPPKARLALRFLVPVAILQILHAYPLPGSQLYWGLVAMCVPCAIAIALAAERLTIWQQAGRGARAVAVGSLCTVLLVGTAMWPPTFWHDYQANTPLALPGARFVRVDPSLAKTVQRLTRVVKKRCDTFYSAPGFNSLYIFTGLPTPTGSLSNWPGALSTKQQQEVATQLADLQASGERVCIVRDLRRQKAWLASSYGKGPLGKALATYRLTLARVGRYSVSVRAGGRDVSGKNR